MTNLTDLFDAALFDQMVDEGYVRVRPHPDHDLFIANYTPPTQYERMWNEVTTACRGLIYSGDGTVVARPFHKFFNLGENGNTTVADMVAAHGDMRVYEKSDGSLGILYWIDGQPHIATRGSFTSDQALWATQHIRTQPIPDVMRDPTRTYLFEIVFPANRIVVDYGDAERLICLAAIDIETGKTIDGAHNDWHDPIDEWTAHAASPDFLTTERPNHEGFVLHFPATDERVKTKHEEYLLHHRIMFGTTERTVWEYLSDGRPLSDLLQNVPEEFAAWAQGVAVALQVQVRESLAAWRADYAAIIDRLASEGWDEVDLRSGKARGVFAAQAKGTINPSAMFTQLDSQPLEPLAWKLCKPEATKPFAVDVEVE